MSTQRYEAVRVMKSVHTLKTMVASEDGHNMFISIRHSFTWLSVEEASITLLSFINVLAEILLLTRLLASALLLLGRSRLACRRGGSLAGPTSPWSLRTGRRWRSRSSASNRTLALSHGLSVSLDGSELELDAVGGRLSKVLVDL